MVPECSIIKVGTILNNKSVPLKDRFRALFTLRNIGGPLAIDNISKCFDDKSALLKHELAYCLGQMNDKYAIPILISVLQDENQDVIVRHEAAEALGAIGDQSTLDILKKYEKCNIVEIAETCQLATTRLKWLAEGNSDDFTCFGSIDPSPPIKLLEIKSLKDILLNENLNISERYGAMFALRNINSKEATMVLAEGLQKESALFRHEVAFVLGQLRCTSVINQLTERVRDASEHEIVRHECAEALGSIGTDECMEILRLFLKDENTLLRESIEVALDVCEYENSEEFQYADGLEKIVQIA